MAELIAESSCFTLSSDEKAVVLRSLSKVRYDAEGGPSYIQSLRMRAYREFPGRLLEKLESLKSNDASYCVFDNIPIDEVFGSPTESGPVRCKSGFLSENVLAAFGSILAEPYSIRAEGRGLINDLVPLPEAVNEYTGCGSHVELDLHIENASQVHDRHGDTSPLGLMLLGLRTDPYALGPKTWVSDARRALALLANDDVELLYGKHFIIRQPYRWRLSARSYKDSLLSCILTGPLSHPRVTAAFYPGMVVAVDDDARAAYLRFYAALKQVSVPIDIRPGRLVYINNRFTLHARDKFNPTYDGNGHAYRWVQRLFLASDLWNFRRFAVSGCRVFIVDDQCERRGKV